MKHIVRVVWVLYAVALFLATHFPVPESFEEIVSTFDKVIHAAAFFVLGVLTILAICREPPRQPPSPLLLLGLLAYAALDEYLQGFVNRTPDLTDWLSDATGIVAAYCLMWGITVWKPKNKDRQNEISDAS